MKPWHAPLYGGMSEESARRSYEASLLQPPKPILNMPEPATPEEIARMKASIEVQLDEYEQAKGEAVAWYRDWKARQPRGFRAKRTGELHADGRHQSRA